MNSIAIVLLGDSMTDTFDFMESGFLELREKLEKLAPNHNFSLKNHGVGSTNVKTGFQRVTKSYNYEGRNHILPSVIDENPSLVVIESFAYNHGSNSTKDIEEYIQCHQDILKTIQENTKAKILLLATIAPNRQCYQKGVTSLHWTDEKRNEEYNEVIKYFEAFIDFAKQSGLPFLNVFAESLTEQNTGNLQYISNVDYIHLSYEGRLLIAEKLAGKIIELVV